MTETTGELLMGTARALRRRFGAALAEYDVTPAQARALRVIGDDGSIRLSALAEQLHIAPRSATEVVDALEARGLVARVADPADRRATCVEPTDHGRALREVIGRARRHTSETFLERLPEADRQRLDDILRRLGDA